MRSLRKWHLLDDRAGAMANILLGFSAFLVFGVPIGRIVTAVYDWKVIFWVIGIFILFGIFAIAKVIPTLKSEVSVPLGKQLALLKYRQKKKCPLLCSQGAGFCCAVIALPSCADRH
ncbi:MFS transporter [Paenibacillus thalictri]|nr:MFS transporter [Paenibacillus thalictri]